MLSIENSVDGFNSFITSLQQELGQWVARRIEAQLEGDVENWLHRKPHKRRKSVGQRRTQAQCQRCGSRYAERFLRNGHRQRQLVTGFGVLTIWLPRVVCMCGGSVTIPFSILQPYQRLWDDLVKQIGRWANLGLSLRQMQGEIGDQVRTQVGLRKLNTIVQQMHSPRADTLSSVPPVIQLDAIWVTLLEPAGTTHKDRLGRQRRDKSGEKVCVLVALGLYPQSGRWGILGWTLAESESQDNWERLLVPLETRGVYRERGVALFIHDGGSGLIAALNLMYPYVPHQRCLFHKLRNLWQAIQPPDDLTRPDARAFKRDLIHQLQAIFYASTRNEALQLRDAFRHQWQATQSKLIATLYRDWPESVAFFRVLTRFPTWPRKYLRTTSLLERVNRMIRGLFRPAGAFHSTRGLLAAVARVLTPLRLI